MRAEELLPTVLPPLPGYTRDCHFLNWRVWDEIGNREEWVGFGPVGYPEQRWFCSCPSKDKQHPFICEHLAKVRITLLAEAARAERAGS